MIKRVSYHEPGEYGASTGHPLRSDVWGTLIVTFIFILLQVNKVFNKSKNHST